MTGSQHCNRRVHWLPLIAAGAVAVALLAAQEKAIAQSRSSASVQLGQQLEQRVTVAWQGQELGHALQQLAETQRIDVWIDRRVNPSAAVELSVSDQPLREALSGVLTPLGYAASPYHGVLYVGPEQAARELLTLSALARRSFNQAPPSIRAKWLRAEPWSFPRFSEPRALLSELVKGTGAQLRGDEQIPHDLWPARTLPTMTVVDRAVLLLAGFDLTCEISANGRDCRVAAIERPVQISNAYTVTSARATAIDAILKEFTAANATRRGTRLTLAATVEEHERIREALQGRRAAAEAPTKASPNTTRRDAQRFTLKITNQPVGAVVDQLARQLKLTIDWAAPAKARNSLISCEVREATLDEMLAAILSAAELTFTRTGDNVTIKGQE